MAYLLDHGVCRQVQQPSSWSATSWH